jgi:hypothetical protein
MGRERSEKEVEEVKEQLTSLPLITSLSLYLEERTHPDSHSHSHTQPHTQWHLKR